MDANAPVRQSHHNASVQALHDSLSDEEAHSMLHTIYTDRRAEVGAWSSIPFGTDPVSKTDQPGTEGHDKMRATKN